MQVLESTGAGAGAGACFIFEIFLGGGGMTDGTDLTLVSTNAAGYLQ